MLTNSLSLKKDDLKNLSAQELVFLQNMIKNDFSGFEEVGDNFSFDNLIEYNLYSNIKIKNSDEDIVANKTKSRLLFLQDNKVHDLSVRFEYQ